MIYFLIKNWKLFMDIVLVVGLILGFTFLDPFGLFMNTKTKATANLVTGIRDIGELVTAEYYGEVISSWKEYKLTRYPSDSLIRHAENLYTGIVLALAGSNKNEAVKRVRIFKSVEEVENDLYQKFLAFLGNRFLDKKFSKIYDEKEEALKNKREKEILEAVHKRVARAKTNLSDSMFRIFVSQVPDFVYDFPDFYTSVTQNHLVKGKVRKKNIVLIGRGSVKAGFDFGTLTKDNFLLDLDRKTVHFFGFKPKVLDADINPWFIPERRVKGFELVDYSGDVNFEDAKLVKKHCKEKLLAQARKADIIGKAEENGKEALGQFFALLLDESGIQVAFHTSPFDHDLAIIAEDSLIDMSEAIFIGTRYQKEIDLLMTMTPSMKQIREKQLARFIKDLQQLHFYQIGVPFSFYSIAAAKILVDSFHVSTSDFTRLKSLRDTIKFVPGDSSRISTSVVAANPTWFLFTDFQSDFNSTLDLIGSLAEAYQSDSTIAGGSNLTENSLANGQNYTRLDSLSLNFDSLKYGTNYQKLLANQLGSDDPENDTTKTDLEKRIANQYTAKENEVVLRAIEIYTTDQNQRQPIQNFTAGIRRAIDRIQKKKTW